MVHHLIEWAIFIGWYGGIFAVLRLAPVVARGIGRFRARRRAGAGHWSLVLLVHLDDQTGLMYPSVQILGNRLPTRTKLRLVVVDPLGVTRYATTKRVPPSSAGREVSLPPFRCAGALHVMEPTRWRWNVTLSAGRRRIAESSET